MPSASDEKNDHLTMEMLSKMLRISQIPKYKKALADTSNRNAASRIEGLHRELKDLRTERRTVPKASPHTFVDKERKLIARKFSGLLSKKKTAFIVEVGGPFTPQALRGDKHTLKFVLGHMWRLTVYDIFYERHKNDDLKLSAVILSARERRTNVPHVVVHRVTQYNFTTRKLEHGYIGQTTLGTRNYSSFRLNANHALQAGILLADRAITKKLKIDGETE